MRYYNNSSEEDNDEGNSEVDLFFQEKDETDRYMEMVQAGLEGKSVNQETLDAAIRILENSFFWKFRSSKNKIKLIEEMYSSLSEMVQ